MKNKSLLAGTALAIITVGAAQAADTPKAVEEIKAAVTPGEIVLSGHEMKTLYDGSSLRAYHVCVKKEKDAAAIRVIRDRQVLALQPGECQDVTGRKIEATPAQPLSDAQHSVVTFHHLKTKQ